MGDAPKTDTLAEAAQAVVEWWFGDDPAGPDEVLGRLRAVLAAHDTPPPDEPRCNVKAHERLEGVADRALAELAEMKASTPEPSAWVPYDIVKPGESGVLRDPEPPTACATCNDTGTVPATGQGSDGYEPCPDCVESEEITWTSADAWSLGDVSDSEPPALPENWCDTCEGEGEFIDDRCTLDMVSLRCKMPCPDCAGGVDWPACEHPVISTAKHEHWFDADSKRCFDCGQSEDVAEGGQLDPDDELIDRAFGFVGSRDGLASDLVNDLAFALRRKRDDTRIVYEQNEAYCAELTKTKDRLASRSGEGDRFRSALADALTENERLEREMAEARSGLQHINRHGCEHNTRGSCLTDPSRSRDAEYADDQWCDPCIAADALGKKENS